MKARRKQRLPGIETPREPRTPAPRYRNEWGEMVAHREGQWVHVQDLGVKTWVLDPLPPASRELR